MPLTQGSVPLKDLINAHLYFKLNKEYYLVIVIIKINTWFYFLGMLTCRFLIKVKS